MTGNDVARVGGRDPDAAGRSSAVTDPDASVVRRGATDRDDGVRAGDDATSGSPLVRTLRFGYRHSTALVAASLLWTVCSLPLVTLGPASVGVYATVLSLRETGRVDRERVLATVRETLVPATLVGALPTTFLGIAALYATSDVAGLPGTALTVGALYAGVYLAILAIPTLAALAAGAEARPALRRSYVWLAGAPAVGVQLLVVTLVVAAVTVGLTVGFPLLFAGLAATYHVEVLADATADGDATGEDPDGPFAGRRSPAPGTT